MKDCIPIEWIEKWKRNEDNDAYDRMVVDSLIRDWKREQEKKSSSDELMRLLLKSNFESAEKDLKLAMDEYRLHPNEANLRKVMANEQSRKAMKDMLDLYDQR